jgi:hypothetical protein
VRLLVKLLWTTLNASDWRSLQILLPLADKQPGDATLENTRTATNLNDSANPFDVLHLVEAMERSGITPADSSPDYDLEGELPDLFNTDAPARMLVPQEPLLEDEEFGEFIELSFFMTVSINSSGTGSKNLPLHLLRGSIQSWR